MTSAFVSYAREDRAFVGHLADALRARSIIPAWDQDHSVLPFSAPWRQEIESAIRSADKFVFVISPYSISSMPCASEIATAQACGKQIVPIAFRLPPDLSSVPWMIGELNWIFFDGTTPFPQALDQLVGALTTDLEWVRMHTRLSTRAAEWTASGRDSSRLLRGGDLRAAEAWIADAASHPQALPTEAQRQYLAASRRTSDRNSRRLRFALISGVVIALTLAVIAVLQRNQARHEATVASAHALAARASAALATDPVNALHLALQSTKTAQGTDGTRVLREALAADRERMVLDPGSGTHTQAVWSPTTDTIATTGKGDVVLLWDARTGRLIRTLAAMPDGHFIERLSYDATGKWLAAISQYGDLALYNTTSGQTFDTGKANGLIHTALDKRGAKFGLTSMTWDPQSGRLFVFGSELKDVVVVDPRTDNTFTLRAADPIQSMTFAPHGSRAFVSWFGLNGRADDIVDLTNGSQTALRALKPGTDYESCWTPNGSDLVVWAPTEAQDQTVHVLDGSTGEQVFSHVGATTSAGACGDDVDAGPYAMLGDYEGQATILERRSVQTSTSAAPTFQYSEIGLRGHTAYINSVATSADGAFAASGSDDGTVRVWDVASGAQRTFADAGVAVNSVGFSPDNGLVLAVLANGQVAVYDAGTGEAAVRLSSPPGTAAYALGFVANGTKVWGFTQHLVIKRSMLNPTTVTISDARAVVWNAASGAVLDSVPLAAQLSAPHCPVHSLNAFYPDCTSSPLSAEQNGVAISTDGNELAYASGHSVVERNLVSGRQTALTVTEPPTRVLMSADGTRVLVVDNTELRIWTPADGQARSVSLTAVPLAAAMDAAGDRAVIGYTNGTTSVWNLATATQVTQFAKNSPPPNGQLDSEPLQVAISSDGTVIATGDTNGQVRLRSVADGRLIARYVLESNPRPIAPTYPVGELRFVDSDKVLLALNYPQPGAGDYVPPGAGVVIDVATGAVRSRLSSPARPDPPYEPGVDVSPDGQFVLTGIEGFAPTGQPQGEDAVYDTTTGDKLADLSEAAPAVSQTGVTNLAVENAWSPSGTRLVTASTGIYPCDACGSLADMQAMAQQRIAWETPIGPHSAPPPGNPLG